MHQLAEVTPFQPAVKNDALDQAAFFLDLETNLTRVQTAIAAATKNSGRRPEAVTLVVASKTVDVVRLQHVIDLGQLVFGENRIQEGKQKWRSLKEAHPGIELHLLGPLQTNKARDAVALFDVIQSVDRVGVAEAIAKESDKQGRRPKVYIQVNTSCEPQKSGAMPEEAANLVRVCREQCSLDVAGLMCIPAAEGDHSGDFTLLRKIARDEGINILSMGMSGDYVKAIEQGATHVRIGSAIFGARPTLRI